jgi:hypothetical protein
MSDLTRIPDLRDSTLELLEVAGVTDLESLADSAPGPLAEELSRANNVLKLADSTPELADVEEWIHTARVLIGRPDPVEEVAEVLPVNHEQTPEIAAMLNKAPFAIPLPARQLMEFKLAVSDIPAALLLNRYTGDLDMRVADRVPVHKPAKGPSSSYVQVSEPVKLRMEIDTSRMKTTGDYEAVPRVPKSLPAAPPTASAGEDRVALIRAPREKTNRGVNPNSRRYIRGVLHSHPHSMLFGAFVTILTLVTLPLAIVSGILLLLSDQVPEKFGWVPSWLLAFPAALPLLGLLFLIWGLKGSCRICGQRLFVPRNCLKNSKAHHVPGLGYIVPVSFHMLVFRWFRCTYCGTPVRLKK